MATLSLTIGDKNLSSWSLRPWVLMTHENIPFTEENIRLDLPETRDALRKKSPSGLVPFLTHHEHGETRKVWDSLAICEFLNDLFPEKQLWPANIHARARARALAAEMHTGFAALRTVWPMQFTRAGLAHLTTGGVKRDIDRINSLWTDARRDFGAHSDFGGGDFLFGGFSIADAMFAPVVSRFSTYGPLTLSREADTYCAAIMALPAMKAWGDGAKAQISQ